MGDVDRQVEAQEVGLRELADLGALREQALDPLGQVTEGAIAFTRILCGAYSTAIERVIAAIPPLAAV